MGRSLDERISLTSRSLFLLPVTNADNQTKVQKSKEERFSRVGVLTDCSARGHRLCSEYRVKFWKERSFVMNLTRWCGSCQSSSLRLRPRTIGHSPQFEEVQATQQH